jgi:hypothetical protein
MKLEDAIFYGFGIAKNRTIARIWLDNAKIIGVS